MTDEMLESSLEFILNSHMRYARDAFRFRKQPEIFCITKKTHCLVVHSGSMHIVLAGTSTSWLHVHWYLKPHLEQVIS